MPVSGDRRVSGEDPLREAEQQRVAELRAEANGAIEAFTRYAIQGLAAAFAGLFAVFAVQANGVQEAGLASILITFGLLAICNIGVSAYANANRVYGYQLLLERLANPPAQGTHAAVRKMGWEEGMVAWRIVHTTLYRALYHDRGPWSGRPRKKYLRVNELQWFRPKHIPCSGAAYTAGGNLRGMLRLLLVSALAAYGVFVYTSVTLTWGNVPFFIVKEAEWYPQIEIPWFLHSEAVFGGIIVLLIASTIAALLWAWTIRSLRDAVAGGILSIQARALAWHAVGVAHVRALEGTMDERNGTRLWDKYQRHLIAQAECLARNPLQLHRWIQSPDSE